jgi:hypothetical protein
MITEHNGPRRDEDDIDAAMKMLGETQPPAGIASRVHQRLETAAISQGANFGRRLLIPASGVSLAALALVAIFIQMHRAPENQPSAVEKARLVANTPLAQVTKMPPSARAEAERSEEGKRLVQYSTKPRSRQSRENRHATNLLSYPLTREEKLLLRFAQSAKPADLQSLNPEYQAKMEARQDAEFAAYLKSGRNSDEESATQSTESTQE